MKLRERLGYLLIALGVVLLALLLLNLWSASHAENLYIRPDSQAILLEECDRNFVGPCQMYALPRDAAANIFDAIQPYRR